LQPGGYTFKQAGYQIVAWNAVRRPAIVDALILTGTIYPPFLTVDVSASTLRQGEYENTLIFKPGAWTYLQQCTTPLHEYRTRPGYYALV